MKLAECQEGWEKKGKAVVSAQSSTPPTLPLHQRGGVVIASDLSDEVLAAEYTPVVKRRHTRVALKFNLLYVLSTQSRKKRTRKKRRKKKRRRRKKQRTVFCQSVNMDRNTSNVKNLCIDK